jgi:hypothetical protein
MNDFMNYSVAVEPRDPDFQPASSSVRRLIRNLRTCQYFRGGQWTADPNLAEHFSDAGKVVEACIRHHLVDVELVLELNSEPSGVFETHLRLLDQPGAASNAPFDVRVPAAA